MRKHRDSLLAAVTVLASLALCLVAIELVLRVLPVTSGMRTMPVTADDPVFHFTPNRDFLFSRDWNLALVNRGHINNAGFVNDQDYRLDDPTPVIAVIGDSYIEAAMVPFGDTMHGRLAKALAGKFRVYSFAASGAPLSQYLVWARHAARTYGAQALVINVVGNDFDESLATSGTKPGFWHYVPDPAGALRLRLFEYRRGFAADLVSGTAIGRYLVFNLQLGPQLHFLKDLIFAQAKAEPRYAGQTAADANAVRVASSKEAIDAFFRDLPEWTGLPAARIAFTMDGFRYPKAAEEGAGSYFDLMRRAFQAKARSLGYEVIDLDPAFFARHRRTGEQFQYRADGHWNPAGHEVAYEQLMSSRLIQTHLH